ncbi:MAG: phosphoribosylanthranilate isomerase [Flavobacteriaceae bacterium]|jgi:phosphoribosylanthranilate isomerase|nr:phosphoribosylanthranilate isomerase [Flavobacteriaceae bacterium]
MKIKVCGMKDPHNILELAALPIDYIGLIFYSRSPRYAAGLDARILEGLPEKIRRVGVFVDEEPDSLWEKIAAYKLDCVQLHGKESVGYCKKIKEQEPSLSIIKAFNVSESSDFQKTEEYEEICSYFLFDTKTKQHGGSGEKFDWCILDSYQGKIPFFLSGGISLEDSDEIKKIRHPKLYGLDLNSRFESEPGLKNIQLVSNFIKNWKNEQN